MQSLYSVVQKIFIRFGFFEVGLGHKIKQDYITMSCLKESMYKVCIYISELVQEILNKLDYKMNVELQGQSNKVNLRRITRS